VLSLDGASFRSALDGTSETVIAEHAERLLAARFLKEVGAFTTLDTAELQALAARVVIRHAEPGEVIVREGDIGESCFAVRSGSVEVLMSRNGSAERVATLARGAIFGEGTLVTGEPRNASVRAVEPTELLELDRESLLSATRHSRQVGRELVQLLRLREFPRRREGVALHEQQTADGVQTTVLKNPARGTYYRLSPRGRFIWDHLDGRHDLRRLTLEVMDEFGVFAPDVVADIVGGLAHAGFVESKEPATELGQTGRRSRSSGVTRAARGAVDWQTSIRGIDGILSTAYRRGVRLLFTRPAVALMGAVAVFGVAAFVIVGRDASQLLADAPVSTLPWIYFGLAISLVIHEAGHAFATKFYGRSVYRAGVGFYWFTPVAFVDTSDMWLGTPRQRIVVSLAGPAADLVTAGVVSILALTIESETVAAGLWALTLPLYLSVVLNLNPLLEFDGYHVLTDVVDRPNLRAESLSWLRRAVPRIFRSPGVVKGHWLEVAYAAASIVFVFVLAGLAIVLYRVVLQSWADEALPHAVAVGLSWVFAAGVIALTTAAAIGDLRRHEESRDRLI
jgi:CRP-like cAMP-binding protein/Zn-dependent protease